MDTDWHDHLDAAARLLREARLAVALTGAGVSVASGIPDFRSPGGLWTRHNPFQAATIQALRERPRRVWEFLLDANKDMAQALPNAAHLALAELEAMGRLQAVVTQNIDGLHAAAGSRRVIEFHGNVRRYHCMACQASHPAEAAARLTPEDIPWICQACGGVVRPDIVFFGEAIPAPALLATQALARQADLALVVGTSGEVAPANQLPWDVKAGGGRVIEINAGASAFGAMPDLTLRGPAEDILPLLTRLVAQPDLPELPDLPDLPELGMTRPVSENPR